MTTDHDLTRIVKSELERLKELCLKDGKLIESCVLEYHAGILAFSRMGYNTLKHDLICARYIKALNNKKFDERGYYRER